MNKVDLVEKKKDLLKVAEQFNGLPGFERWGFLVERERRISFIFSFVNFTIGPGA